jgi:hypothetical protein
VRFELGDLLAEAFGRKMFKPNKKLNRFVCEKSKTLKYPWKVTIAIAPLRKPYAFQCKRITVKKGWKVIAGDNPRAKSKWKTKDYMEFGKHVGSLVEDASFDEFHDLLSPPLRKKKKVANVAARFERLQRTAESRIRSSRKKKTGFHVQLLYADTDRTFPPETIGKLDPDSVRAEMEIEFAERFLLDFVVVEQDGALLIGHYKAHQQW